MYLFSPFLNDLIRSINKKRHLILCCVILGTFSVLQNIIYIDDFSGIKGGYSFLWFCALYIIAAYFRLYVPSVVSKQKLMFAGYVLCILIVAGEKIIAHLITPHIFGRVVLDSLFYSYNSIFMVGASLFFFQFFRGITISGNKLQKFIGAVSPLTFAVYLIHDNSQFRTVLWNLIDFPSHADSPFLVLYMFGVVFCIFTICCLIESVRKFIFEKLRISSLINKWCDNIQMRITRFFDLKISN